MRRLVLKETQINSIPGIFEFVGFLLPEEHLSAYFKLVWHSRIRGLPIVRHNGFHGFTTRGLRWRACCIPDSNGGVISYRHLLTITDPRSEFRGRVKSFERAVSSLKWYLRQQPGEVPRNTTLWLRQNLGAFCYLRNASSIYANPEWRHRLIVDLIICFRNGRNKACPQLTIINQVDLLQPNWA